MELKLALEMSLAMAEAEALPIHLSVLAFFFSRFVLAPTFFRSVSAFIWTFISSLFLYLLRVFDICFMFA